MIGFVIRAVFGLLIGVICGASATAAVGSLIGLAYWVTGNGFAYSWLDWPLGGGMFGSVVGAAGGAIGGTLRCVTPTDPLRAGRRLGVAGGRQSGR